MRKAHSTSYEDYYYIANYIKYKASYPPRGGIRCLFVCVRRNTGRNPKSLATRVGVTNKYYSAMKKYILSLLGVHATNKNIKGDLSAGRFDNQRPGQAWYRN